MNNQDKNSYVKRQITNALLELLKERELSDITIGEITDKAEVSRNSFYRNYSDKEDIIRKYLYQFLSEWDAEWKQKNSDSNAELFGHLFKESYLSLWGPSETVNNVTAYTLAFVANGILGWIEEWLKRGMCESAESMSSLLSLNGMF